MHKIVFSNSPSDTLNAGYELGKSLKGGEVILLNGDLGAGKTTFTKGIALGLEIEKDIISPTFVIIKEYFSSKKNLKLKHIDMYRLRDYSELYNVGIDEAFSLDTIVVIEWNFLKDIPSNKVIDVSLFITGDNSRKIEIIEK